MWNVPVTAADAQVGDADVSGRPGEGVITHSLCSGSQGEHQETTPEFIG